jgi:hypothetical protein
MATTESQEEYTDAADYPRWWNWDEDGDVADGTFVRFTRGRSEFGPKIILVLLIAAHASEDGEERSIWMHETALESKFRDELLNRPGRDLDPGERVIIKRGGMQKTLDGKRDYRAFDVRFPDRPEPTTSDLFQFDDETRPDEKPTEDDGVPF